MPRISEFYGITILMFFGDHNPPHFHAAMPAAARESLSMELFWTGNCHAEPPDWSRNGQGSTAMSSMTVGTGSSITSHPVRLNHSVGVLMVEITAVEGMHDRVVHLQFSDGSDRVVDLAPLLWGPVFEDIASEDDLFAQVEVDHEIGTIVWPNGADLDPDVLHGDHEPANPARSNP